MHMHDWCNISRDKQGAVVIDMGLGYVFIKHIAMLMIYQKLHKHGTKFIFT